MPIDIDKLMRFEIPRVRQNLTPKDVAFYALSVGMARDPLDAAQLRFVDPLQGPAIVPSMVLVMAHPGFWLADPATGVDPAAVLHASQGFEILGPLPDAGEVTSHTRISDVVDKGEGKSALIRCETDIKDDSGRTFARLERTIFIRGGGGFGGKDKAKFEREAEPSGPADFVVDLPTSPEQALNR